MQSPLHIHTPLTHLQLPNTYVRMLFVGLQFSLQHSDPGQADTEAPQPGTALIAVPLDQGLPHQQASGEAVERVNNIKFLGIHITSDLTWSMNTAHLVKKAQQRLFFLRKLQLLTNFYRATGPVWYGSCTAQIRKDLGPGGENSSGDCGKSSSRPGLQYTLAGSKRRPDILQPAAPTHPGNGLFVPLPSGK
ncbi:hypothetical protein L3Q82_019070, partial [Scortum barcoo]